MDPVIAGTFAGLGIAIIGYVKNAAKEDFNPGKFLKTIALGSVVGLSLGILGFNVDYIQDTMVQYMPTIILYAGVWTFESLFKGLIRMLSSMDELPKKPKKSKNS